LEEALALIENSEMGFVVCGSVIEGGDAAFDLAKFFIEE
jgi:hypothetical protein